MATTGKAALRERLLAARRRVADDVRAAEARMLREQLEFMVTSGSTVCAYVPVGAEPGSVEMLDMLLRRAGRVLLPVARTAADNTPLPLCWGEYRPGTLTTGRWGLLEPAQPWLPASALADAALVLVPALAVDRRGVRLGRGRGSTTARWATAIRGRGWSRWCATRNCSTSYRPSRTTSR